MSQKNIDLVDLAHTFCLFIFFSDWSKASKCCCRLEFNLELSILHEVCSMMRFLMQGYGLFLLQIVAII